MTAVRPYWYADAVLHSDLPAPSRLIALSLCSKADNETGAIRRPVSQGRLKSWTGLSKGTVKTHLKTLELAGWIVRRPADLVAQRTRFEATRFVLVIPDEDLRAAAARSGRDLGQEITQAGTGDDPGLGQQIATLGQDVAWPGSGATTKTVSKKNSPRRARARERCSLGALVGVDGWCCPEHEIAIDGIGA